jgi:PPOX class probable F420-dependent enzyme
MTTTHAHYEDTSSDPAFAALGNEQFLSLTTFRRSGERVSTPMWVGRDGDALIMFTPQASGKVKRLHNSPRVELRPCNRLGRVKDSVEPVTGMAEVLTDEDSRARATEIIRRKYGLGYRVVMGIERLIKFGQEKKRVVLRITRA